jgi:hypothetical protein
LTNFIIRLNHDTACPQPEQAANHSKAGIDAKGLHKFQDRTDILEVTAVADEYQRQTDMEHIAEQPDPLVGFKQAFEQHDLTANAKRHATTGRWGGSCRNL